MSQYLLRSLLFLCCTLLSFACYSEASSYSVLYSENLQQRLNLALQAKGIGYKARTRHLTNKQPLYTNRLILADSPYLLQHAHNPVNWYPWGEEAFAKAKRENKPIFLSIGYATCHWCHVMEEESFDNIQVAKILNEHFVVIKVDREQHPDIDAAYMTAVMMLTGRGGWPMSSFLTAEGKPFFGGTYYPQADFIELLIQVKSAWDKQHQSILAEANRIAEAVKNETSRQSTVSALEQSTIQSAIQQIFSSFDAQNGGFSTAPKFPNEPKLMFLLQIAERNNDLQVVNVLEQTLSAMGEGGIYDQIGGGFHRYSTDKQWRVPHFEKMLYNQAYLARVYSQAYRLTQNPSYARIAKQTLDYVIREMRSDRNVFYSATDADSEGEEGTYFVWAQQEITQLFKPENASFITQLFGISKEGNFEGKNIFFLNQSLKLTASQRKESLKTLLARLEPLLEKLRTHRKTRIPPLTDNKVIVAWNGMLITALAEASDILNKPKYLDAAKIAAASLWNSQRPKEGLLWRIKLDNKYSIPAKQDDYAHFSEALIFLYDLTNDTAYLHKAESLANEMTDHFMDVSTGTLVMSRDQLLFTHPKDAYDSALPSGNAVAVRVFNRLFKRTGKEKYRDYSSKILQTFSSGIVQIPHAYSYMLAQLDELKNGEVSAHQYAARSTIKVHAKINKTGFNEYNLRIHFKIKPEWHINSNKPLQKELIATTISPVNKKLWQLEDIQYPQAKLTKTNFGAESLALYQGNFTISAKLIAKTGFKREAIKIGLNLQACNQDSCLAPELLTLFLSPE